MLPVTLSAGGGGTSALNEARGQGNELGIELFDFEEDFINS